MGDTPKDRNGALLQVQDLSVGFERQDGSGRVAVAVNQVSFELRHGRTLCLVGESGCGKSVTAMSLLRLLPSPPSRLLGGRILFEGRDLASMPERELVSLRGNRIGMIFQDPMTSLNPVIRVGAQISEGLARHRGLGKRQALDAAVDLLAKVGIDHPEERVRNYPHQMSGGMRQRVMIAMALACDPALLIADEPTTALDVTVQNQILALMRRLIDEMDSGLLLITHDLGVVGQVADEVAVMYAGRIVEQGPAAEVLSFPAHPYTEGLLHSLPGFDSPSGAGTTRREARLGAIPGTVPDIWSRPAGCTFSPRCPYVYEPCTRQEPGLFPVDGPQPQPGPNSSSRLSRCWLRA